MSLGASLAASLVEGADSPVDIRNKYIQVEVSTLQGDGVAVDCKLVLGHVDETWSKRLEHGVLFWRRWRKGDADHLYFQQGFVTIVQKVFCFSAIDSDDTEQELTT